jgi:hypothetical protein
LTGFPLKPYIAKTISKIPPENRIDIPGQWLYLWGVQLYMSRGLR